MVVYQWLLALLAVRTAIAQVASYVRYDNYSAVDFDNSLDSFVPTADECLAQSTASPYTNGVAYNDGTKSCKLLTNLNNEILVTLRANAGWVTYVKDISAETRVVFKSQEGLSTDKTAARLGSMFLGTGGIYTTQYSSAVQSLNKSASCNCTYRNAFLDYWKASQVFVQYAINGLWAAQLVFKSVAESNSSWFSISNAIATAPYNLATMRLTTFLKNAMTTQLSNVCPSGDKRDFTLWTATNGCSGDVYYTVATSEECCSYSTSPYPSIFISLTNGPANANKNSIAHADFMVITAKVTSRVIFKP